MMGNEINFSSMKPLNLPVLLILLLIGSGAGAQSYNLLNFHANTFWPNSPGHDVSTSFPYAVTDLTTGTRDSRTFEGELKGKFTNPLYMFGATLEIVRRHNGGDFGAGLFTERGGDHGYYLQAGYKYVISFGGLLLKPGLDFYYVRGIDKMGSIDNRQKEIYLLGYTAHDQFTITESDGYSDGGTVRNTYDAERLDVNYRRNSFLAQPKFTLATTFWDRISLGLELGYMIQMVQKASVNFEQNNHHASDSYSVGKVKLTQNGTLTGASAAFTVGVLFK